MAKFVYEASDFQAGQLPNDVVAVAIPGMKQPVYVDFDLAEGLKRFIREGDYASARKLVVWFGGKDE